MYEKTLEQVLNEAVTNNYLDIRSTDDMDDIKGVDSANSFNTIKNSSGSYEKMIDILTGRAKFEYSLLDDRAMLRTLIDQVKAMIKQRNDLKKRDRTILDKIKELTHTKHKTPDEIELLDDLQRRHQTYQLQKRLMKFANSLDKVDDVLRDLEQGNNVSKKRMTEYINIVGDIEDVLFDETYVKYNLNIPKKELVPEKIKAKSLNNFPIKFISDSGEVFYGLVRPPSGIITWEGSMAREAWINDEDIQKLYQKFKDSKKYRSDDLLKIRLDGDYKVRKEPMNNALLDLRVRKGLRKIIIKDDDLTIQKVKDYIFNENGENLGVHKEPNKKFPGISSRSRSVGDFMDSLKDTSSGETFTVSINDRGTYVSGITKVIDTIEFWRFIKSLFK